MQKTFISFVFVVSLAVIFPNFAKASCGQFSDHYSVSPAGCYTINHGKQYADYIYTGKKITADTSDNLSMFYEEGSVDHGYTASYIADGKEHNGDVNNTGKTYTASCNNVQIHSVRIGMFIGPFDMTFFKNPDGTFTLTETITNSDPFIRSCSFVQAP